MLHALIFLRTEPAMGKKSKSKLPKKDRSGFAGICPNLQGDEIPRLKPMGDLGKKRWQELSNEMGNPVHQIDHPDDNVGWACLPVLARRLYSCDARWDYYRRCGEG